MGVVHPGVVVSDMASANESIGGIVVVGSLNEAGDVIEHLGNREADALARRF